jgi:hypothetical protein
MKTEKNGSLRIGQKIGFLLLVLLAGMPGVSQNKSTKSAVTLDLAGNSGIYSLNGEYEIGQLKKCRLNARVGFGYGPLTDGDFVGIPIGFNLLTGTKKHHLELGLGASYIKGLEKSHIPAELFGNTQELRPKSEAIYFVPTVGYRYDNLLGGLILKIYYSPLITVYDFFDKEKFLNQTFGYSNSNFSSYNTGGSAYNHEIDPNYSFPIAKNKFGNFGLTIGYRF